MPTILSGYGGFDISETPVFSATLFQWFEAGGLYALPNLRGGGEYGDAWHEAGMLANKQNVFDDFIAAAEWLDREQVHEPAEARDRRRIERRPVSRARRSRSGRICFARRSSLVPLLDMLRYQDFLMARYWVPEYGSAEDANQFKFLLAYSPYQHVKAGTKYPAVLLTAGENDSRVHALHARKMAAALQAATASDPAEQPVLLWVDREAGHGQGKPLNLRAARRRRSAHLRDVAARHAAAVTPIPVARRAVERRIRAARRKRVSAKARRQWSAKTAITAS